MTKEEILKCEYIGFSKSHEKLYKEMYIVPREEIHDSGYKYIKIVGKTKENEYFSLTSCADVIDLEKISARVSFDIHPENNLIRMFVNAPNKYFKLIFNCSNFTLEVVDG